MRVRVDTQACISSGNCVRNTPVVFDQREDDGVVSLRTERPSAAEQDDVRRAVSMCPARAITVTEEGSAAY
jgi:ferredoxin